VRVRADNFDSTHNPWAPYGEGVLLSYNGVVLVLYAQVCNYERVFNTYRVT